LADGKVARVVMSSEDEQQLLAEKPGLRQLYEAQVWGSSSRIAAAAE
jgi:hypothetical protein